MLDVKDHYKPTMPEASLNQRLIVAAQGASSWCHVCGQPAKCSIKDHNANRRHADYKPRTLKASPCSCRSHPCRPSGRTTEVVLFPGPEAFEEVCNKPIRRGALNDQTGWLSG